MAAATTLAAAARFEQDIRKSRFVANAAPVDDPAGALAFFARVGVRDATHNCWAYRIGAQYRFNDDGEPSGTAGKPILVAIDSQGLDRVAVVVTRWFGGIKLGAGGLVRAYGGCAAECLRMAPRIAIVARTRACIRCDFAAAAALHAHFAELSIAKLDERFDAAGVELAIELPKERLDALVKLVGDLTRGRGRVDAAT
jgi:uncharacterized YigZ family protein